MTTWEKRCRKCSRAIVVTDILMAPRDAPDELVDAVICRKTIMVELEGASKAKIEFARVPLRIVGTCPDWQEGHAEHCVALPVKEEP